MDSSVGSRQRWVQADGRLADLCLYDTIAGLHQRRRADTGLC